MSQIGSWCKRALAITICVNGAAVAVPNTASAAQTRVVRMTTYFREGPGTNFRAVDEAQNGTRVAVLDCTGAWCRITLNGQTGYVASAALDGPTAPAEPLRHPACFVTGEAGYHGLREVRVCRSNAP